MEKTSNTHQKGFFYFIEKTGNALPHPALLSYYSELVLAQIFGCSQQHPKKSKQ